MKKLVLTILTISIAAFPLAGARAEAEKLTGSDWSRISEQRKLYFIFGTMEEHQARGVVFTKTASDYLPLLDKKVSQDRDSGSRDMKLIFDLTMRENEPSLAR
jgi:Ni/Co efflux regulator RcnB